MSDTDLYQKPLNVGYVKRNDSDAVFKYYVNNNKLTYKYA